MATTLNFDKLNRLEKPVKKSKAIPYRQYFGEMFISPEEMRERIELAEAIEDVMLYILAYWEIASDADLPMSEVKQEGINNLTAAVGKHIVIDPYVENHIKDVVNEVVDVTQRRAKENEDDLDEEQEVLDNFLEDKSSGGGDKDYWTSQDRAQLISENEANAFYNYDKYREAKATGKTKKTWVTEGDEKVRITHTLVEEKTIDIDGLFLVGFSQMRFPMDWEYDPDPSEIINCRCTCEYK